MGEEKSGGLLRSVVGENLFPLVIAVLSLAVALSGALGQEWLRYDRVTIGAGEVWRLVSGHLAHLGWMHLALNLAGLALVWALVGRLYSQVVWSGIFLLSALATSAGLFWLNPQLHWYVGLSGVLHGLLLAAVVPLVLRRDWEGIFLLGIVVAKLLWEQQHGAMPGSAEMAGGEVVVDAHWYGGLSGLALGFLALPWARSSRPQ